MSAFVAHCNQIETSKVSSGYAPRICAGQLLNLDEVIDWEGEPSA